MVYTYYLSIYGDLGDGWLHHSPTVLALLKVKYEKVMIKQWI